MSKTKTNKKVTKKAKLSEGGNFPSKKEMGKLVKTGKVVTKRAPKKSEQQLQMEKFQKNQEKFTAKMKIVSTELDVISKKHGIKLLAQGYDIKTQSEFTIGSGINGHIDSVAMGEMAKRTFA